MHRFPIHTLKIDRSFIGESGASEEREIVRTIIMLAKNLRMKVVAEGVETIRQLEYLKRLKCDYGQGYYFSPPLEVERVGKWLQREAHAVIEEIVCKAPQERHMIARRSAPGQQATLDEKP